MTAYVVYTNPLASSIIVLAINILSILVFNLITLRIFFQVHSLNVHTFDYWVQMYIHYLIMQKYFSFY